MEASDGRAKAACAARGDGYATGGLLASMRALLLTAALLALPTVASADVPLATGRIVAGDAGNMAFLFGDPTGLTGFGVPIPDDLPQLSTRTVSEQGLPFRLRVDLYEVRTNGYLATCVGGVNSEVSCVVPAEAGYAFVGAYVGASLTVEVHR